MQSQFLLLVISLLFLAISPLPVEASKLIQKLADPSLTNTVNALKSTKRGRYTLITQSQVAGMPPQKRIYAVNFPQSVENAQLINFFDGPIGEGAIPALTKVKGKPATHQFDVVLLRSNNTVEKASRRYSKCGVCISINGKPSPHIPMEAGTITSNIDELQALMRGQSTNDRQWKGFFGLNDLKNTTPIRHSPALSRSVAAGPPEFDIISFLMRSSDNQTRRPVAVYNKSSPGSITVH